MREGGNSYVSAMTVDNEVNHRHEADVIFFSMS